MYNKRGQNLLEVIIQLYFKGEFGTHVVSRISNKSVLQGGLALKWQFLTFLASSHRLRIRKSISFYDLPPAYI